MQYLNKSENSWSDVKGCKGERTIEQTQSLNDWWGKNPDDST